MGRTPIAKYEIADVLARSHMLSAPEIHEKLRQMKSQFNKTTIYRTLDKMLSDGELCRHTLGSDVLLYELRSHHHDHLVCEECGKVEQVECSFSPPKVTNGFTLTHHHVTLFGVCAQCS